MPQVSDPRFPPSVPTGFDEHTRYVLGGNFLDAGNPFTQDLLGQQQRAAERGYAGQRAQLGAASQGLGQFGSSMGNMAQGQALQAFTQGLGDQQTQLLGGLYESERDRMMQAL